MSPFIQDQDTLAVQLHFEQTWSYSTNTSRKHHRHIDFPTDQAIILVLSYGLGTQEIILNILQQ